MTDASQVSAARRAATEAARLAGFDEVRQGKVALIATEMATNLLKHAGGGEIAVERFADGEGSGIELVALDRGPGIADLSRSLADGYSTAGSAGNGLGAISRLADRCEIYSRPGLGTAITARLMIDGRATVPASLAVGAALASFPGETVCGDQWGMATPAAGPTLFLADGTGHGALAATAAATAVASFAASSDADCMSLAESVHRALAPTRGAAIAIARLDAAARLVRFVGIGNIAAMVISAGSVRRMVSHHGTAGHSARRIQEFTYPYEPPATVVLCSDGVSTRWDPAEYPGLAAAHPSLLAGVVLRDHRRGRDDAAVVAMREDR